MLVFTENYGMAVGVAVCEWKIDGQIRHFVIFPYQVKGELYVEVETPAMVDVISPALPEWVPTKMGFGDDNAGYPMDESTMRDLYAVWDDGAALRPRAADRLYSAFARIIEHYTQDATKYLQEAAQNEYDQAVAEAKRNGWDANLITRQEQTFPYFLKKYKQPR